MTRRQSLNMDIATASAHFADGKINRTERSAHIKPTLRSYLKSLLPNTNSSQVAPSTQQPLCGNSPLKGTTSTLIGNSTSGMIPANSIAAVRGSPLAGLISKSSSLGRALSSRRSSRRSSHSQEDPATAENSEDKMCSAADLPDLSNQDLQSEADARDDEECYGHRDVLAGAATWFFDSSEIVHVSEQETATSTEHLAASADIGSLSSSRPNILLAARNVFGSDELSFPSPRISTVSSVPVTVIPAARNIFGSTEFIPSSRLRRDSKRSILAESKNIFGSDEVLCVRPAIKRRHTDSTSETSTSETSTCERSVAIAHGRYKDGNGETHHTMERATSSVGHAFGLFANARSD
ncbi:hypothetical protein HKX48_001516 [Thoreauomyces humboldtii]|nr:hypothetical protein HKX48_001516 [Thoreauomyces humboldtii]